MLTMLKKYIHISKDKKAEVKKLISDEFFKMFGKSIALGIALIVFLIVTQKIIDFI